MNYFDLQSSQRYFHIIAFKTEKDYFNNKLLRSLKFKQFDEFEEFENFNVRHFNTISEIPYYRGEKDYSLNGDNLPPYKYDVLLVNLNKLGITLLCFPFKALTKFIVNSLVVGFDLLSNGNFIKVDIDNFVKQNHEHTDYIGDDLSYFFSGVSLSLKGDDLISMIKLEGDKPLDSHLYKDVFREKVEQGTSNFDRCVLKCSTTISKNELIPKTKSSIHIDKHGNYKVYIHSSGKNIITIPLIFSHLNEMKCLVETPKNPVLKLTPNEE